MKLFQDSFLLLCVVLVAIDAATISPTTVEVPTKAPTTAEEITVASTTAEETTVAPTTAEETTVAPTTAETTVAPTTAVETTVAPTTAEETTVAPTTAEETTVAPTTAVETTVAPTTAVETTVAPTTAEETTVAPTTAVETTVAPTTAEETTVAPTTAEETTVGPTTAEETTVAPTTSEETTVASTIAEETTVAPTTAEETTVAPTTAEETTVAPTTAEETTVAPTGPVTSEPVPPVTYRCFPNGTIEMDNPNASLYTKAFAEDSSKACSTSFSADFSQLMVTGCTKKNESVAVTFVASYESGNIIVGKEAYLSCSAICGELPDSGVTYDLHYAFTPRLETVMLSSVTPQVPVSVAIRTEGAEGEIAMEAIAGDELYWTLDVPDGYTAMFDSCTAFAGTTPSKGAESIQLIEEGCSLDPDLFSNAISTVEVPDENVLRYFKTFNAFRFYSDPHVGISCVIRVCPPGSDQCEMDCGDRRRRSVAALTRSAAGNNAYKRYVADASILIDDIRRYAVVSAESGAAATPISQGLVVSLLLTLAVGRRQL